MILGRTSGLLKQQAAGIASLVGRKVKHIQIEKAEQSELGTTRIIRYLDAWEKPVGQHELITEQFGEIEPCIKPIEAGQQLIGVSVTQEEDGTISWVNYLLWPEGKAIL